MMERKLPVFVICLALIFIVCKAEDDLEDFDFSLGSDDSDKEIMLAQESRQYQTFVKPPINIVKPHGVTNSHRPQYDIDSTEDSFAKRQYNDEDVLDDFFGTTTWKPVDYKPSYKFRSKEAMIREAVLKALERKDHVGKFAQILPIVRAMSGSQRIALASLVASQVSTPPGRSPLNLAQVRSMFGNNANTTSNLMLPILFDMANLIRRAVRSGKEPREVKQPQTLPTAQLLRRSYTDDDAVMDDEPFHQGYLPKETTTLKPIKQNIQSRTHSRYTNRNRFQRTTPKIEQEIQYENITEIHNITDNITTDTPNDTIIAQVVEENRPLPSTTSSTTTATSPSNARSFNTTRSTNKTVHISTSDLSADATNQTITQDLPVAEKLRSFNRYVDRKGNVIRRAQWSPAKPSPSVTRRTTAETTLNPVKKRPAPARKMPSDPRCELFTNSLCLLAEDYPTEAILLSIRRNKAAAGALLADYRDPNESAVDGVTAAQEAKYDAEHYLVSNRRGDTANRDFAGAGEAGFMCPSTVKYARPQRARATSGQWKYIVNTGEHTQTLRLEKCLKAKESCTYLTDNFKSKCVQVYNYHRLLTWDQQNGLHMDIFKVPTCCSCHIEGYSVAFPPLGHRVHESSAEQFPGEDLSSEHGNGAFESVQPTAPRPTITKQHTPFGLSKPLDIHPVFGDNQNLISGAGFPSTKLTDNDDFSNGNSPAPGATDSYGNDYFPDSFNQASSIRNVKRPLTVRNPTGLANYESSGTLPSYLEPPTPSASSSFGLIKETSNKYKLPGNQKRGRPRRRPIRKKLSGVPDDLMSSGTFTVEAHTSPKMESLEDFNDDADEYDIQTDSLNFNRATIAPKLQVASSTSSPNLSTFRSSSPTTENTPKIRDSSQGKRVNYNYHPIIDFFEEDGRVRQPVSIDREDIVSTFIPVSESEWKPIKRPVSNAQAPKLTGRQLINKSVIRT